jgi:lactate permease
MTALWAATPILTPVVLLLALRQSALRAGAAGLAVALAVALLVPAFRLPAAGLGQAVVGGALTTVSVAYVLLGGLLLYAVLREGQALQAIATGAARAVPDPGRRALLMVFGLSVFLESATGFGIGIVVVAPLFAALGYPPRQAAILALTGQCAVTWGALGIGTSLGADLTGIAAPWLGVLAAPLSVPLMLLSGAVALWLTGGAMALWRRLPELLLYTAILAAALAGGSYALGIEVAGMIAGLAVVAAGLLVNYMASGRRASGPVPAPDRSPAMARALGPLALLLVLLLATRVIPPLAQWLGEVAVWRLPAAGFRLPVLYHPGFWLILTAAAAVPILRVKGDRLVALIGGALRQWGVATLAVAGFLSFSQVMLATGMTAVLAAAVAEGAGGLYVVLLPAIGGLGGFLTASNAGSNAMFAQFQSSVGARLGLPADLVAAAQNAAGANATLASPGRVVLAAAVTGQVGQEADLMRPALVLAVAGLLGLTAILWMWTGG